MIAAELNIGDRRYEIRPARRDDVPAVVDLLADDMLGRQRESGDSDLSSYYRAFDMIKSNPNQELVVVERDGEIVATLDLSVLASLSRQGAVRLQVEAVRVAASERGNGLGSQVFAWVIDHAREQGHGVVQLTTDRSRAEAHTFYERLGFTASHLGYKLCLQPGNDPPPDRAGRQP